MKRAIILHGMPDEAEYRAAVASGQMQSDNHWLAWLRTELQSRGVETVTPELPQSYAPEWEAWKTVFEKFQMDEDTALIGHSCGAGFLLRYLSENHVNVGKVALVAPFLDLLQKNIPSRMLDFEIDSAISARVADLAIFVSDDDWNSIKNSAIKIQEAIPGVTIFNFSGKGHFTLEDMGTAEFPELLAWITG